jgi:protein disulfide-isomerase A1
LVYIFLAPSVDRSQVVEDFLPVARDYEGRIVVGTVDVNIFPDLLDTMHVAMGSDGLAFAIHEPTSNEKYPLVLDDKSTGLTPDMVSAYVHDFLDGKLKPTIKSAPIPDTQPGPVVEVVGLTYDDIVLNPDKDVLVEFYTPWCGPCKALLPMYEKLASLYVSDDRAREYVTIAKIDYESNDVPDKDIRGFPWFKLYPARRKGEPVTYEGGRTVEEWAKFIAAEGSHGAVLDANKTA